MKTVREFVSACQKLLAKGWKVQKEEIPNQRIRLRPPNFYTFCDCPIIAVHRDRFGTPPQKVNAFDYGKPARKLGIPPSLQDIVAYAADHSFAFCGTEDSEMARLSLLRGLCLPLDRVSRDDMAEVTEKGHKLLQTEKARRKKEKDLQLQS